jgi:hypothetical protein
MSRRLKIVLVICGTFILLIAISSSLAMQCAPDIFAKKFSPRFGRGAQLAKSNWDPLNVDFTIADDSKYDSPTENSPALSGLPTDGFTKYCRIAQHI